MESESTFTRPGGHFGDVKWIGVGMVNESLSALESELSCMNLDGGCAGDN